METKGSATGVKNAIAMATFPTGATAGTTPAKVTTSSSNAAAENYRRPADNSSPCQHVYRIDLSRVTSEAGKPSVVCFLGQAKVSLQIAVRLQPFGADFLDLDADGTHIIRSSFVERGSKLCIKPDGQGRHRTHLLGLWHR
jgi:hypothetical protein